MCLQASGPSVIPRAEPTSAPEGVQIKSAVANSVSQRAQAVKKPPGSYAGASSTRGGAQGRILPRYRLSSCREDVMAGSGLARRLWARGPGVHAPVRRGGAGPMARGPARQMACTLSRANTAAPQYATGQTPLGVTVVYRVYVDCPRGPRTSAAHGHGRQTQGGGAGAAAPLPAQPAHLLSQPTPVPPLSKRRHRCHPIRAP